MVEPENERDDVRANVDGTIRPNDEERENKNMNETRVDRVPVNMSLSGSMLTAVPIPTPLPFPQDEEEDPSVLPDRSVEPIAYGDTGEPGDPGPTEDPRTDLPSTEYGAYGTNTGSDSGAGAKTPRARSHQGGGGGPRRRGRPPGRLRRGGHLGAGNTEPRPAPGPKRGRGRPAKRRGGPNLARDDRPASQPASPESPPGTTRYALRSKATKAPSPS